MLLNSAMDMSIEPEIDMQKAFEAKNSAVNQPISETEITETNNLQMIEDILNWIGKKEDCNKLFELFSIVENLFLNFSINLESKKLREDLNKLIIKDQNLFHLLYADMQGIYTGESYHAKNQKYIIL